MKVSIITTSYNSERTIRDTLESVKNQNYPNIEHIIIDGASKDNTLAIVKEYAHVAQIISEKDKGIYDAMNKGVAAATGDLIGILNSDDFYAHSEVITDIVNAITKENKDTIYADLEFVDNNNIQKITRIWKSGAYVREKFLYGWMPPHPTFFVKKGIYQQLGVFNILLKSAADYELMLRFLYKHNVSTTYLSQTIIKMRNGGQSNASLVNRWKANREDSLAWQLNDIKPKFYTIYLKPLRKLKQFFTTR